MISKCDDNQVLIELLNYSINLYDLIIFVLLFHVHINNLNKSMHLANKRPLIDFLFVNPLIIFSSNMQIKQANACPRPNLCPHQIRDQTIVQSPITCLLLISLQIRPKWANVLFVQKNQRCASFPKLIMEMPLF